MEMKMPELLSGPWTVFIRKFRWLLSCPQFPTLEKLFQSIAWCGTTKTLKITIIDCITSTDGEWQEMPIFTFLNNLHDETLVLTTLDGCGNPIHEHYFKGVDLVNWSSEFDYNKTDVSTLILTLSYKEFERKFVYNPKNTTIHLSDKSCKCKLTDEVSCQSTEASENTCQS